MRATAAGVDTWSVSWYMESDSFASHAMERLATEPGPRSKLIPEAICGHRVGWFPGAGLMFAEGHPSEEGLCAPGALPEAHRRLCEALQDYGIVLPIGRAPRIPRKGAAVVGGEAGVRRLDLTVDLQFDSAGEGLAALSGIAALPLSRTATTIHREVGGRRVETVYLKGPAGKRVLGRVYDKGVESGTAERGRLIRPEDQRRFQRAARVSPQAFTPEAVKGLFQRRFVGLWKATEGVTVASVLPLAQKIARLRDAGKLTQRQAESLAGYLLLDAAEEDDNTRRTAFRRRALARQFGLVLADGTVEEVEVDLHEVLEAALEAPGWDS